MKLRKHHSNLTHVSLKCRFAKIRSQRRLNFRPVSKDFFFKVCSAPMRKEMLLVFPSANQSRCFLTSASISIAHLQNPDDGIIRDLTRIHNHRTVIQRDLCHFRKAGRIHTGFF